MVLGLFMTITPIVSAVGALMRTKVVDVGENLGQARLELARSLDFDNVGTVAGSPVGVIEPSELVEIQGIEFLVETNVSWVGSAGGGPGGQAVDVVPQGGDGVEGFYDPGVDFKWLSITVTPQNQKGEPIVFDTIISPPGMAATEGISNLVVQLQKDEPIGNPTPSSDWPELFVIAPDLTSYASGLFSSSQLFADLPPLLVGEEYTIRLGPTLAATAGGGWRIDQSDLDSGTDRIHVGVAETASVNLTIYKPGTLTVNVKDAEPPNNAITDATLNVRSETEPGLEEFFDASQMSPPTSGTWFIDQLLGVPLPPGQYTLTLDAPGFVGTEYTLDVPAGYYADLDHIEDVLLTRAVGGTVNVTWTVSDADGREINGAVVEVDSPSAGIITLVTDETGQGRLQPDRARTGRCRDAVAIRSRDPHIPGHAGDRCVRRRDQALDDTARSRAVPVGQQP